MRQRVTNSISENRFPLGVGAEGIENIRVNVSGCLDRCEFGPNMVIYPEGVWYRYESQADIDEILETHLKSGGRVNRLMLQPEQLPPKH